MHVANSQVHGHASISCLAVAVLLNSMARHMIVTIVNHAQRTSLFVEASTELDMPGTVARKECCRFGYYIAIRHGDLVSNSTKPSVWHGSL